MKRLPILTIVGLVVMSIVFTACQPVRPVAELNHPRHVRGDLVFPGVPEWGGIAISMRIDFTEVNSETHEAAGFINWRNFQPQPPAGEAYWKVVDSEVRYAFFGADIPGGDPNVVVVITQIKSKAGWGQGDPGTYGYFWFREGGPGGVDQWGNRSYTMDPWQEFYPADKPPVDVGYFTMAEMQAAVPVLPLTVESGDLTID